MRDCADGKRSWFNLIIDLFCGSPKLQSWIAPADGWRQPGVIIRGIPMRKASPQKRALVRVPRR
jgi:hypothetical protein